MQCQSTMGGGQACRNEAAEGEFFCTPHLALYNGPATATSAFGDKSEVGGRFYLICAGLAAIYLVIVLSIASVSIESASVAATVLGGLTTLMVGRLEGVQFRRPQRRAKAKAGASEDGDQPPKQLFKPTFNFWYLLVLAGCFAGFDVITGMFAGMFLRYLQVPMDLTNTTVLGTLIAAKTLAAVCVGILCSRSVSCYRYTYAGMASFVSSFVYAIVALAPLFVAGLVSFELLRQQGFFVMALFWFLYVAAAMFGVWTGMPRNSAPIKASTDRVISQAPTESSDHAADGMTRPRRRAA